MELYDNNIFYLASFLGCFLLQFVWNKLRQRETVAPAEDRIIQLTNAVFCICLTLAISTLFRLFPGNNRFPSRDSSVFLYIGKRMTEGKIPYLDLFDHKGPILYFIEYIGMTICKTSFSGVWLLEVLSMMATIALMQKLGKKVSNRHSSIYLAILACMGVCGWKIWQGGNFTEEYALPWITLAAIVFYSFFQTGSYRWYEIILLGTGFVTVFLLRANMIAIWVALMPVVLVLMVKRKQFLDILKCMALFLAGVAIVLLPVFIYSKLTNSLNAMWQNYMLFNISYTDGTSSVGDRLRLALFFSKTLWPGVLAIIITLLKHPEKKVLWANMLFFIVSLCFVTLSGRGYYHYAIILLPSFILPVTVLFEMTDSLLGGGDNLTGRPVVIIISSLLILTAALAYRVTSSGTDILDPLVKYIQEQTSEDDDVLILGNSCWYYLMADRKTDNCYFYQLPPAEISTAVYNGFINELTAKPSKLVVLPGTSDERELIDISLMGIREMLFEKGYTSDEYDEFEAFWLH